ncbi:hypothetical protein OS187_07490 [Xanthomonadaceae bacterium JHOS43]|nr:hypothetical protein [Xanthomonadaceae bacterium JHOS43]
MGQGEFGNDGRSAVDRENAAMGLLDELEQEAARLRGAGDQDVAAQQAREAAWREKLQPAAVRLGEFLTRFASSLTAAQRRIRMVHPIAGYGDVVSFGEAPFECRVTPGQIQHEIEFSFVAQVAPEESTLVIADTPGRVRLISGLLQNHHLSGLHDVVKNANGEVVSGRFQARGRIPVKVHVIASQESGHLKMSLGNVEAFGVAQRTFVPEALNEDTFDALGRYLLRETTSFSREKVGADIRRQLQTQIQRDQVRREWEARLAVQLREDETRVVSLMSPTASPVAFLGRMGKWFRRGS